MVVAHQREHAAAPGGAGEIGVAEHVAGAVDAGPLAVPHGKDAVVLALAAQLRLLRAPYRSGGEVLVDRSLETDVVWLELPRRPHELAVETAERRTAIAGDIAGSVEAAAAIALLLHQAEPHQRLEAGDEYAGLRQVVFVVELDVAQRHRRASKGRPVCPRGVDIARGTGTEVDIRCGPRAAIGPIEARLSQWFRRPRY